MERIEPKYILSESEFNELNKFKLFVEKIWNHTGPYSNEITNELRYEMQDLFNFDDSE